MNQSMAVAYATLGKEFLALILKVVIVRTVVTPEERKVKSQLQLKDTGSVLDGVTNFPPERKCFTTLSRPLSLCCLWSSLMYFSVKKYTSPLLQVIVCF